MPNTPALVGEGVTAVAYPQNLTAEEYSFAKKIIGAFSEVYEMDESLLDPVISVSGSSPAYVYMFIDAIAKSGAAQGIDYETALKMAAKTVRGAAKLLLQSPDGPQILIDRVCSKGGTTIEAVNYMNDSGFSKIIDGAMKKCTNRALELSVIDT
jgi:pyrroline-5-carboxylate reductase